MRLTGIIIRKDGTVPFDDDCHPDVRAHALAWLTDNGHDYERVHGTKHVRIKNWQPPSQAQSGS